MNPLDYMLLLNDQNEWEVWTPDGTGACIGAGETQKEALADANTAMAATIRQFYELISKP